MGGTVLWDVEIVLVFIPKTAANIGEILPSKGRHEILGGLINIFLTTIRKSHGVDGVGECSDLRFPCPGSVTACSETKPFSKITVHVLLMYSEYPNLVTGKITTCKSR